MQARHGGLLPWVAVTSLLVACASSRSDPVRASDEDGDGWAVGDGDCCDSVRDCPDPTAVNPGAYEVLGNGLDDDCDATTSDTASDDCGPPPLAPPTSADDLARAMDICRTTTESAPLGQRTWGLISADLRLADGAGAPLDLQAGVLAAFGTNVAPRQGSTMAALSSGSARAPNDPGYVHPQNGGAGQIGNLNAGSLVTLPVDFLAANGGVQPTNAACPDPGANTQAWDSALLRLRIRVPTNARGLSFRSKFYTAEFPEYVCQPYNDMYAAWLYSSAASLPPDHNIAFTSDGAPIDVNSSLVQVCVPPVGAPPGACSAGALELIGTGMGGWGSVLTDGAGTQWMIHEAPVVPGEIMELRMAIWDAGDHNVDSLVLLDGFRWLADAPAVVTRIE